MINLLPENEKKNLDREYTFRLAAVSLGAVIGLSIIAIIVLLPVYVLAVYKGKVATIVDAPKNQEATQAQEAFKKQIDDAKILMRVLRPEEAGTLPSMVIEVLSKHKTSQNTVSDVSYRRDANGTTVVVRGVARTRDSLSRFTDALTQEPLIANVDVPVSNFAKDANIVYTFTILLK